jgi:hypothetical protein
MSAGMLVSSDTPGPSQRPLASHEGGYPLLGHAVLKGDEHAVGAHEREQRRQRHIVEGRLDHVDKEVVGAFHVVRPHGLDRDGRLHVPLDARTHGVERVDVLLVGVHQHNVQTDPGKEGPRDRTQRSRTYQRYPHFQTSCSTPCLLDSLFQGKIAGQARMYVLGQTA